MELKDLLLKSNVSEVADLLCKSDRPGSGDRPGSAPLPPWMVENDRRVAEAKATRPLPPWMVANIKAEEEKEEAEESE